MFNIHPTNVDECSKISDKKCKNRKRMMKNICVSYERHDYLYSSEKITRSILILNRVI